MPILVLAPPPPKPLAARPVPPVPSLRQLLARHPVLLVIDTSSTQAQVAVWDARANVKNSSADATRPATSPLDSPLADLPTRTTVIRDGEASSALPEALAELFGATSLGAADLSAVAFCAGPGSVLGIRLAAATVRAWRALRPELALYSFQSLPLLATAHPGLAVAADARRESWHVVGAPGSAPGELRRVPSAELAALGAVGTPANFRRWSAPPAGFALRELAYDTPALFAAAPDEDLFAPAPEPDVFMTEAPAYATWTPKVHQAPAAASAASFSAASAASSDPATPSTAPAPRPTS